MQHKRARGKKHVLAVGWGIEISKVCQVHFSRKGGFFVTFPYHPDTPGIAALCRAEPGKTQFPLPEEFSRVTSHKVKYHHPMDGRAHFSGTGKVRSEIWADQASPLVDRERHSHVFTVHLQGVEHFTQVRGLEYDHPQFHLLEFQQDDPPAGLRLVGNVNRTDQVDVDALQRPVVRTRFRGGQEAEALVLAPDVGTPLDGFALFVHCIPEDPILSDGSEDFFLSFQGGFGPGLDDPTIDSSFLVLNYPARDVDHVPSMDLA